MTLTLAMTLHIIREGMTIFQYCGLQSSDHGVIDIVVTAEDAPNPTNDLWYHGLIGTAEDGEPTSL